MIWLPFCFPVYLKIAVNLQAPVLLIHLKDKRLLIRRLSIRLFPGSIGLQKSSVHQVLGFHPGRHRLVKPVERPQLILLPLKPDVRPVTAASQQINATAVSRPISCLSDQCALACIPPLYPLSPSSSVFCPGMLLWPACLPKCRDHCQQEA